MHMRFTRAAAAAPVALALGLLAGPAFSHGDHAARPSEMGAYARDLPRG